VIDEEGTTFQAMTFNGSMPGPLMVVHEGDCVELTLVTPPPTPCRTISTSIPRPARSAAAV
jgi:FtsP/CotA-like multicopper oxidase with cupredoxin domain